MSYQLHIHEIYKIYNHGEDCPYPEYQVEFERGTKFEITDIKKGIPNGNEND